jgi:hypothetical protein
VVDARAAVRHHRRRTTLGVAQEGAHDGVGQGDAAGGRAERGRRGEVLAAGAGVDVGDAQAVERGGDLAGAHVGRLLGATGDVGAAQRGEGLGGRVAELDGGVGQDGVHRVPPSSALDTIIRCTSMVPDATVAAWA